MLRAKGHRLTKILIMLTDVVMANLVFMGFRLFYNTHMPPSLYYGTKSAMVILSLSVLITTLILPPILYFRKIRIEQIIQRNIKYIVTFVWCFIITCRLMTRSGQYIYFGVLLTVAMIGVFLVLRILERKCLEKLRSLGRNSKTVVFIGNDPANLLIYNEIMADPSTGYRVLGYYCNDGIEDAPKGLKKIGNAEDLYKMISSKTPPSYRIDELFCSISHDRTEDLRLIIDFCDRNMIHFFYVPRIFPNIQMSLHPEMLGDSVVFTNYRDPLQEASNRLIKRIFDIVVSLIVLICLLPFLPIVAIIIKKQSPGSIFFVQARTGLNGKPFMCYKFRSMHINDNADKVQATKDDPRKFPFGNFMRRTNIDEFPQFFNVLKGDMSIVGPRPHMLYHTEKYAAIINKYMVRHVYKPGITGLAQISGFRGETEELWQMEGRVKKDIWYIEHWSIWLDIKIIAKTALTIVCPDKAAY